RSSLRRFAPSVGVPQSLTLATSVGVPRRRLFGGRRETLDLGRQRARACLVLRRANVAIDLAGEFREGRGACCALLPFGRGERLVDRRRFIGREAAVAYNLIEVRAHHGERRRPDELRLALWVVFLERHQLCRRELVRRELLARCELVDVEPAV